MNSEEIPWRRDAQQWVALLVMGLSIGWLIGNSASPVLASVLTSLLGLAVGVVAGARSVRQEVALDPSPASAIFDARPAAVLVLGIALAATGGLAVRSHRLLDPLVVREAAWRAAREGRVDGAERAGPHSSVLFGATQSECNRLLSLKGNPAALADEMAHAQSPEIRRLAARVKHSGALVTIVEAICEPD